MTGLARVGAPGRHVYDVIVVGSQLAGLLAGAMLAKRGVAVLVAPVSTEGTEYDADQWRLPTLPDTFEPPLSIPLLSEIAGELALTQTLQREVPLVAPQVILPRERVTLGTDPAKREKELTRVFGAEATALISRYAKARGVVSADDAWVASKPPIPARGWWSRFLMNRHLRRVPVSDADFALKADHPLDAALLSLMRPFGIADAPLSRARVFARAFDTVALLPSGPAGLEALVRTRAREIGADVTDLPVAQLVFEGSSPVGVRLARHDTTFRANAIIAACDTASLTQLLPEERQKKAHQAWPPTSARRTFTIHAIVAHTHIPPGLARFAVLPAGPELGCVTLTVAPAVRHDGKPTDEWRLSLSAVVPSSVVTGGAPTLKATTDAVWAAAEPLLPFARAQARKESLVLTDAEKTSRTFLAEPTENAVLGLTGVPLEAPFKRLWLANRQVVPGLSLEGDAMVALRTVEAVEKLLKRTTKGKAS